MKKLFFLLLTISLFSCSSDNNPIVTADTFVRAADMSYLPLIESEGTVYKFNSIAQDPLLTLKNAGCNTIRIRLWKDPSDGHSGFNEVKALAQRVKTAGLKVWLTVHYSDTWADPGNQTKPAAWQSMDFNSLKTAVTDYTNQIMDEIHPDIIQIGNETNDGMLWPEGKLSTNESQYLQLVTAATTAVRAKSPGTKIMLHFAGIADSGWFFEKVANIDFDYIGLSYYPIWHGKSLTDLEMQMEMLAQLYGKRVLIAETAYPFTLNWNDYTNNIVGLSSQIIPAYAASNDGQKAYLLAIKGIAHANGYGKGFCYWGAEWLAFRGLTSTNGSPWENQALWDFNNNALPAMDAFNKD